MAAALPFAHAANTAVSEVAGATDLSLPASHSNTTVTGETPLATLCVRVESQHLVKLPGTGPSRSASVS